ncbi:MAG: hypothetical protein AAF220_08065, partial [Pseudomonadota bacterium]
MAGAAPEAKQSQMTDEIAIHMNAVHKWYGEFHVLKDINLSVHRGERIVGHRREGRPRLAPCLPDLPVHAGVLSALGR